MLFIVSPAKKMRVVEGPPYVTGTPELVERTAELMGYVRALSLEEAQALWSVSDALATLNYERFRDMDLARDATAACIAYEGIQYQALAPEVMSEKELAYLDRHLRILSGFYGVLKPFDGVVPYRLEMQARLVTASGGNLYEYWADTLAQTLARQDALIVNIASVEYAKAVVPYADKFGMRVVTCLFGRRCGDRLRQVSTAAKRARGLFVRWCAEHGVEDVSGLRDFDEGGYGLDEDLTTADRLVFVEGA